MKVIGCSRDEDEIAMLVKRGGRWIEERQHGMPLFEPDDEAKAYDKILAGLRQSQIRLAGPELVYGTLLQHRLQQGKDAQQQPVPRIGRD